MNEHEVREYCCGKLHQAVKDEVVIAWGTKESMDPYDQWRAANDQAFSIHGRPRIEYDGDGYFDDMSDEIDISHCPFCGKELK